MMRDVTELVKLLENNRLSSIEEIAQRLANAGYRKFEIVDEANPYPREPYENKWPKTGGPLHGGGAYWTDPAQHGLTIRDYFAASALQGMLANPEFYKEAGRKHETAQAAREEVAATALAFADEMLKERAK